MSTVDKKKKHGGYRPGSGRKLGSSTILATKMREQLTEALNKAWLPIVLRAIEQAVNGDKSARDWLTDHGLGKALQRVEMTGAEGSDLFKPDDATRAIAQKALKELLK